MTTLDEVTNAVRSAMLASPYVGEVLQIAIDEAGSVVGVRFSVINVRDLASMPPVIAELRAYIRRVVPRAKEIFLEPDFTERRSEPVPTESIVIRGWD